MKVRRIENGQGMNLSERTRTRLRYFINGDVGQYEEFKLAPKYRSGPVLVALFNEHGLNEVYGSGFPSRGSFTEGCLRELNGKPSLGGLISEVFDRLEFEGDDVHLAAIEDINRYLQRDGFLLESRLGKVMMLTSSGTHVPLVIPEAVEIASGEFVRDNIDKCNQKLSEGDYRGAITNARSLCEDVLFEIEAKLSEATPKYDGDLPKLFKRVKSLLKMDAKKGASGNDALVQLLRGLTTMVNGLSGMSNKFADRHGGENEKSQRHHAELAVNSANTLCAYMLASYLKQHT